MISNREKGVALITALLLLFLISAIIVGMSWMVMTDQRLGGNNKDRQNAFYGAEAGMEKITADVGTTFATEGAITSADITTITAAPPTIPGIQFLNSLGISTYQITPLIPVSSNATILPPSPFSGMQGLITPLTLTIAAQTNDGAEVKLQRTIQVVAIPVFQFGIYSDSDLSFFAGPPFDFGGRIHTNGNLWLASNSGPLYLADKVTVVGQVIRTNLENGWPGGSSITAGGDYSGIVTIATTPSPATLPPGPTYSNTQWLPLTLAQGSVLASSVIGNVSTTPNPVWNTTTPKYNNQLNSGAPVLSLTSTSLGGITTPISLIRRAVPGEMAANPSEFTEQYFSEGALRIMLDDYPAGVLPLAANACHNADMMSLDEVSTGTDPIDLATLASTTMPPPLATWYTGYPLPVSNGLASGVYSPASGAGNGYWVKQTKATITGCIKIEYQTLAGAWIDVTKTILNLGLSGRNINPTKTLPNNTAYVAPPVLIPLPSQAIAATGDVYAQGPTTNSNVTNTTGCTDPSPNAIIRIARLRDNPQTASSGGGCGAVSTTGTDYWPMALYDTREGIYRPGQTPPAPNGLDYGASAQPGITGAGVMDYIELDAANLAKWLKNNQAGLSLNNSTGFTVYFTDRRGEQIDPSSGSVKTGSFGYNNFVNFSNPTTGCPNGPSPPTTGTPEQGEDLEADGILRTYGGQTTMTLGTFANMVTGFPAGGPFQPNCGASNWPGYVYNYTQEARENSPILFRRALKIVDGAVLNLGTSCYGASPNPPCGLTIAAENPVYIQGDYNAPNTGVWTGAGSVAAAVAGDTVTLLSDNWNDVNSFIFPYSAADRQAVPTAFRVALIAGKGIPFPQPTGQPEDFGTDGGLHNFLRYLENWGVNCYYDGSLVSFYYNRQGVGTYKTGSYVYGPPNRVYTFDTNFTLGPQWLPPNTPVLRSINTIGFTQMLMPTQ